MLTENKEILLTLSGESYELDDAEVADVAEDKEEDDEEEEKADEVEEEVV